MADDAATRLAVEGYLYGFPLVFNLEQVGRYVDQGVGANPAAPFNQLAMPAHLRVQPTRS